MTQVPRRLRPRIQERVPDYLTEDEIESVSALPNSLGWTCRLGIASGMRWSEMARAQASDIVGGAIVVAKTKGKRVRRVPLPTRILTHCPQVGKLIPYSERGFEAFAKEVREQSGVARFHTHLLRHSFAVRWIMRGGSLPGLKEVLGHRSIETTMIYGRFGEDMVQREAARIAAIGDGPVQPLLQPLVGKVLQEA